MFILMVYILGLKFPLSDILATVGVNTGLHAYS